LVCNLKAIREQESGFSTFGKNNFPEAINMKEKNHICEYEVYEDLVFCKECGEIPEVSK
jgi:hypothetical protein